MIRKSFFMIIVFISISGFIFPMETQEEGNNIGTQDASEVLKNRLYETYLLLCKKGFFTPHNPLFKIKYMSPAFKRYLIKNNLPSWNNFITDGEDTLYIDPLHEETLTPEESQVYMAHELAHIALRKKPFLNPHHVMYKVWRNTIVLWAGLFFGGPLIACLGRKPNNFRLAAGMLGWLSSWPTMGINAYLANQYNPWNEKFDIKWVQKSEEIVCDVIAATTFPQGAKAGVSLYTKLMNHNGNTNGHQGDHPYTSTRILYHKIMAACQ